MIVANRARRSCPDRFKGFSGQRFDRELSLGRDLLYSRHWLPGQGGAPVLGLTSDYLTKRLENEIALMTELVSQLPERIGAERIRTSDMRHPSLDVDYRTLYAVLHTLDPNDHWAGLSRVYTPEGEILWLCRDHAHQYNA
jgi:hypothetical protein